MDFGIDYNPYSNKIHFLEGGQELKDGSSFLKFQNDKIIFQNCVEKIIGFINRYENISEDGVYIEFTGTTEDFETLQREIKKSTDPRSERIKAAHVGEHYTSSSDAIEIIKGCYDQIKKEFDPYILEKNNVGKSVLKFEETVRPEIPVCVIGNVSVGKSAFINALIGREILPSHINASTAKNVIVRNDKQYSVTIYKRGSDDDSRYGVIIKPDGQIEVVQGSNQDDIVQRLTKATDEAQDPEAVMHQILKNINELEKEEEKSIQETVEIGVPFQNSQLDIEGYEVVLIDTPGSDNTEINQEAHFENLEAVMREQTNALPIFVADRPALTRNDNDTLEKMLDKFENGFSIQNQIIVIPKSDDFVQAQLEAELPKKIQQRGVAVMYVSQVVGLGEKKKDKKHWVQKEYQQQYTQEKIEKLKKLNPSSYNLTPCQRTIPDERKEGLSEALLASGIPQVEYEIRYFAENYADYKKSVNGRKLLLDAMKAADNDLRDKKKKLETDKSLQKTEQERKKKAIKSTVNNIDCNFVNLIVKETAKKYEEVLNNYLARAQKKTRKYWNNIMKDKDAGKKLMDYMNTLALTDLYNENYKDIDKDVREKYAYYLQTYCSAVEKQIIENRESLSESTYEELQSILKNPENEPRLTEVEPEGLEEIVINILVFFRKLFEKPEEIVDIYWEYYSDKLKGKGNNNGIFYRDCIRRLALEYSNQVQDWRKNYLSKIDEKLAGPGSFLSRYDAKIKEDETQIKDLEGRLGRLVEVRNTLENLPGLKET